MHTVDNDTNPWFEPIGDPHDSVQNTHGSVQAESESHPSDTAPDPQPSPPAAATNESPPPVAQVPREREGPVDPQVASLRSMFPDFDDTVLQYVLESVRGDQGRAIDTLLGMSDPNFVAPANQQSQPILSQTDLDEQLARRLMLEEQQEHQANWQAQQQQQQQRAPRRRESMPYEERVHQQPPNVSGEKDTITEIQEQLGKIAESGKKTIGTLFSKVKAKIQEFDQPKTPQGGSVSGGTEPRWGAGSSGNSYQYEAQQSFFNDPNLPAGPPAQHVQGYDTTPYLTIAPSTYSQPSPQAAPTVEPTARSVSPAFPTGDIPRSSQTGGGIPSANIDPGKLGLLPKRPVSLLHTQSPSTATEAHDDDDEDLEYAENPFEEGHK